MIGIFVGKLSELEYYCTTRTLTPCSTELPDKKFIKTSS